MGRMGVNKVELVELLAKRLGTNRIEANRVLNAVTDTIIEQTAATGKVSITGFGVFERVHREARIVRNPKTGAKKPVEAMDYVRFRPGSMLKRVVSGDGS